MRDLEERLRRGRPPEAEPPPGTGERLWAALQAEPRGHGRARSPEGWRRTFGGRGGRLLGVALLALAGGGAVAYATGVIGGDRGEQAAAAAPPAEWGPPTVLSGGHGGPPRPRLGIDGAGGVVVAWSRGGAVEASSRPAGGAWGRPVRLSPEGVPAGDPEVAVAGDGSALAVWQERRDGRVERRVLRLPDGSLAGVITRRVGGRYVLVARRRPAGGAWEAPVDVSEAGGNRRDAAEARVVATADGFIVAWARADRVETRRVALEGTLDEVRAVGEAGEGQPLQLALAADSGGEAVLTWGRRVAQQEPAGYQAPVYSVEAVRGDRDGWGDPVVIAGDMVQAPQPAAAIGRGGEATVAYLSTNLGLPSHIAAARADAAGEWGAPVRLSSTARSAYAPNVAIDGDGRAVAHWSVGAATQYSVADDSVWSAPVGHGSGGLVGQYSRAQPALASDGAGRLLGAFARHAGIEVRDWPRGGPFGRPQVVTDGTGWQFGFGGIAASPSGAAAVVIVGFGRDGSRGRGWDVRVAVRDPEPRGERG
ncbi:hypothetical protein [Miltoncostaea oceani]|uniref:hypothetical protein n=1 Tax=Miltoncostaea oceani TaxID=2843216 RepID=UPI001C3E300E|nr:hypothetical protein [Miltoncostaea oceani]